MSNITSIVFAADGKSVTVTDSDGVATVFSSSPTVAPTDTEVDILLSDGTVKKFVPAA